MALSDVHIPANTSFLPLLNFNSVLLGLSPPILLDAPTFYDSGIPVEASGGCMNFNSVLVK
ncbi:hypothetical protein LR48_Vigan08g153400 [Vigna angularis]|uniref:Uncharacterized protein n=1 Tax=Phaseolus angularis TaxID=3914 RepID=A0A0L9V703_PHAAN|nr:hypothetical protein LR48_Vigan08g153400 [Vigna angularis]